MPQIISQWIWKAQWIWIWKEIRCHEWELAETLDRFVPFHCGFYSIWTWLNMPLSLYNTYCRNSLCVCVCVCMRMFIMSQSLLGFISGSSGNKNQEPWPEVEEICGGVQAMLVFLVGSFLSGLWKCHATLFCPTKFLIQISWGNHMWVLSYVTSWFSFAAFKIFFISLVF